ncbi:hypothetical protein IEN85_19065 [Pelagicoccus sp. NFK12]|uniref:TonB-dependent receptor n=1 Tax=Pelagicoccus enzymogenes TaxID=2773457 RepID=A0A927FDC2_9BACT|nr:hypothetical protein [Pelagicoccus enzymogenes]MBD5781610.1 hypothetical protein [Pelagicoccus enzymogenes]
MKALRPCHGSALLAVATVATLSFADDNDIEEDTFELSPFIVDGSSDSGYHATETLAGSRLRTNVGDIGGAMDIFTKDFLEDIGADDFSSALEFATNTGSWDPDLVSNPEAANARDDVSYTVRGFKVTSLSRDFFKSLYGADGYNTQRLTFSRGPNSILYGIAQPGGIANSMTMRANFRNTTKFTANYDTNGGHRATTSFNRVLIDDKLAIVANTLYKYKSSWIDGVFSRDKRFHAALKYRPFSGSEGIMEDLEINLSHEKGRSKSQILGRSEPIGDGISEWIAAGKPVFDNINTPEDEIPEGVQKYTDSSRALFMIKGVPGGPEVPTLDWSNTYVGSSPSETRSLLDTSIIPKDVNYLGSAAVKYEDFQTTQIFVNKKFGKLYLDLAYNSQEHGRNAQDELRGFKLQADPNMYLPNSTPDNLIPNPYAGKYFIQGSWVRHQPIHDRDAETVRFSASYDLDFQGRDDILRHLGKFRFAAMQEESRTERFRQFSRLYNLTPDLTNELLVRQPGSGLSPSYTGPRRGFVPDRSISREIRNTGIIYNPEEDYYVQTNVVGGGGYQPAAGRGYIVDPETGERLSFPIAGNGTNAKNSPIFRSYIDPEKGLYATGGAIPTLPGYEQPIYGDVLIADGYTVEGYPNLRTDENGITLGLAPDIAGGKGYEKRVSQTYTMQHYLFGGRIVTTLGWRSDDVDNWGISEQMRDYRFDNDYYFYGDARQFDPRSTTDNYVFKAGDPTTKSIVVKPNQFVSFFYSQADNFNPVGSGNNIYGEELPNPSGLGEDAGVRLNFGPKFNLSLSAFRTTSKDERQAKIRTGTRFPIFNQDFVSETLWKNVSRLQNDVEGFVTDDTTDYLTSPYRHDREINWVGRQSVQSEGVELRMTVNPTRQLRMMFNFSTQDSQINEVGPDLYTYWMDFVPSVFAEHPEYLADNPEGQTYMNLTGAKLKFLTYHGRRDDNGKLIDRALTIPELIRGAQDDVLRLSDLIGFSDSSQPKSSANFVGTYTFGNDSNLKGWAFGVNARWRDVRTLGYPVKPGPGARLDAANPYTGGDTLSTGGFIRFKKKFGNVNYTGQIQITNLFSDTELVPFGTDKAGTGEVIRYKYQAPRTIDFRNTLSF